MADTAIVPLNRARFPPFALAPPPLLRLGVMTGTANGVKNEPMNVCFQPTKYFTSCANGPALFDLELVISRRISGWVLATRVLFAHVFASGFFLGLAPFGFLFPVLRLLIFP